MASAHPANPQTWNRYSYTWNNPINLVDPLGLDPQQDGRSFTVNNPCQADGTSQCGPAFNMQVTVTAEPDLIPTTDIQMVTELQTMTGVENPIPPAGYTESLLNSNNGAALGSVAIAGSRTPQGAFGTGAVVGGLITGAILLDLLHDTMGTDPTALPRPIPLAPPAPNGPRVTDLYRAVSPEELKDITSNAGAFRNPPGVEVKYFSTTQGGAISYAHQTYGTGLYQGPYTLVGTQIPSNLISPIMRSSVDRGIDTVVVPTPLLPTLSPARIIGPIPSP